MLHQIIYVFLCSLGILGILGIVLSIGLTLFVTRLLWEFLVEWVDS